jgi:hypothetical protein
MFSKSLQIGEGLAQAHLAVNHSRAPQVRARAFAAVEGLRFVA